MPAPTTRSRVRTSLRFLCIAALFLPGVVANAADADVIWINLVHASVTGDVLQKTSGCDGCADAGASSQQQLTEGDGYVEFFVGETTTFWVAGLSQGDADPSISDIDFAVRFNGAGWADVLESGVYQGGDTPYAAGDVFRVAVVGGRVQYFRNGVFLRESARAPAYPLVLDSSLGSVGATIRGARIGMIDPPPPAAGGGFVEKAGSPALRARFTRSQIEGFLPANGARGPFAFPAPYHTDAVRLTNAGDCESGQDCLWPVGYSYWRNTNVHTGSPVMLIFLGMDRARGGGGPTVLAYDKASDQVQNLGPLFASGSPYSVATGEGWYFSGTRPTILYTYLVGDSRLRRYDVLMRQFEQEPAFDLRQCRRRNPCPPNAAYIFQPHSSDDDQVHSATVQDSEFERLGCVVYRAQGFRFTFHPKRPGYGFDECHVDKSGRWLVLLETTPAGALTNRIVDLGTGAQTVIEDAEGALGHLDMGWGYAVGADNFNPWPNATILLRFPVTSMQRPVGPVVHFNKRWDIVAANHVAHGNAMPGVAPASQFACGSNASRVADMADEIICFPLDPDRNPDQSLDVLVVGQVMTDLDAIGGYDLDGDDYEQVPKGNLDVTGRYFIWTTNLGGERLDAFVVKIPAGHLGAAATSSPATRRGRWR
jgi:hypothetical protein